MNKSCQILYCVIPLYNKVQETYDMTSLSQEINFQDHKNAFNWRQIAGFGLQPRSIKAAKWHIHSGKYSLSGGHSSQRTGSCWNTWNLMGWTPSFNNCRGLFGIRCSRRQLNVRQIMMKLVKRYLKKLLKPQASLEHAYYVIQFVFLCWDSLDANYKVH